MQITKTILIAALMGAGLVTSAGAAGPKYQKFTGEYGAHSLQRADLYLPEPGVTLRGLVVWLHGGGWSAGDKSDGLAAMLPSLLPEGVAVLAANYRLRSAGAYPNSVNDVQAVLSAIEQGGCPGCQGETIWRLAQDLSKGGVAVTGFSAGGYLAVMGTMSYLGTMQSSNVRCVTNIAGPVDLRAYPSMTDKQKQAVTVLADGNPTSEVQTAMSPVTFLELGYWNQLAPKVTWYLRYSKTDKLTKLDKTSRFTELLQTMHAPVSLEVSTDSAANDHDISDKTLRRFVTGPALHCLTGKSMDPVQKR